MRCVRRREKVAEFFFFPSIDDQGGRQPHSFKPTSFTIPTMCAVCETNIWGLSKQGMSCKSCGMNVHAKCELKVRNAI
jgi:hypothetical protein